jgi:hypothetical protein
MALDGVDEPALYRRLEWMQKASHAGRLDTPDTCEKEDRSGKQRVEAEKMSGIGIDIGSCINYIQATDKPLD